MAPVRSAEKPDCEAIAGIYNEAIAEGRSTFETEPRSAADVEGWLDSSLLVGRWAAPWQAGRGSRPTARATAMPVSPRAASTCARAERGRGLGGALASALTEEAERAGLHKIVGKLFADNEASRRLVARHGFREVGVHLRHGQIDGEWRDVVLVERLLGER